ncbi:hypothetical protein K503DRAFT_773545, partial [Rhizopogon vinicolor AM-OR11-026]
STASQPCQTDWQNSRELSPQLILYHHTQTMRFSFLVIIVALTASMSVSACSGYEHTCHHKSDCCGALHCINSYCTVDVPA